MVLDADPTARSGVRARPAGRQGEGDIARRTGAAGNRSDSRSVPLPESIGAEWTPPRVRSGGVKVPLERLKDYGEVDSPVQEPKKNGAGRDCLRHDNSFPGCPFGGRRWHRAPQASALAPARLCRRRRAAVHRALWEQAARPRFSRRRIYDARLALCLVAQGVREFATVNLKDFAGLGFRRVFNPLA